MKFQDKKTSSIFSWKLTVFYLPSQKKPPSNCLLEQNAGIKILFKVLCKIFWQTLQKIPLSHSKIREIKQKTTTSTLELEVVCVAFRTRGHTPLSLQKHDSWVDWVDLRWTNNKNWMVVAGCSVLFFANKQGQQAQEFVVFCEFFGFENICQTWKNNGHLLPIF